jgi:GxxExxY protein
VETKCNFANIFRTSAHPRGTSFSTEIKSTASGVKSAKNENELSKLILDAAFRVHSFVGPGMLENAYEACLAYELRAAGLKVQTQLPLPLVYRDVKLEVGYRLDVLVEDLVIIEIPCNTLRPSRTLR